MNTKRSKKYTIPKLILVTILGLIGIILIKKSNILSVNNYDALFACIKKYTIEILLGLMCIIFFFYYALFAVFLRPLFTFAKDPARCCQYPH